MRTTDSTNYDEVVASMGDRDTALSWIERQLRELTSLVEALRRADREEAPPA
jgi:hypothetical protein